jgi:hypothetical protein
MRSQALRVARLVILASVPFLMHCRANNPVRDEEIAAAHDRVWYDMYGDRADCQGQAPATCPIGSYDPAFVDACVAKGHQAKSCGCIAACSGQFAFKAKGSATTAVASGEAAVAHCPETDLTFIRETWEKRTSESSRCFAALVCNGDSRDCVGEPKAQAVRLRGLARGDCRAQVVGQFCPSALKETFACDEASVDFLSELYDEAFQPINTALRRCLREHLCNKTNAACTPDQTARVERAVQLTGGVCGYWLASFCSIDGK